MMSELELYNTMQSLKNPNPQEYDEEDQVTFDDLIEELKDRNNF